MSVMIDSDVLVYLVAEEPDPADIDDHANWMAARELVAMQPIVRVSSLSWFEVYRYQFPDGSLMGDRLESDIAKHVIVEPFDVGVSERAARLFVEARSKAVLCQRCFAVTDSKVCKTCKRYIANHLRLLDAMIVAHAEQLAFVERLYSFDGGVITLGGGTRKSLSVLEPPASTGVLAVNRRGRIVLPGTPEAAADPGDSVSMMPTPINVVEDDEADDTDSSS